MSLMVALKRMFRSSPRLSDIERAVLETVRAALDPSLVDLWDRQIQAINKIQRLPKGVEVDFYRMKDGRPHRDPAYAFPNKTLERGP